MSVNVTQLFITIKRSINFATIKHVPACTAKQMSKYLKGFIKIYPSIRMVVKSFLAEIEFDKTIHYLM